MKIDKVLSLSVFLVCFAVVYGSTMASADKSTSTTKKTGGRELAEQITVKLDQIKKIQEQEKNGDELYVSVTEFAADEKPRFYQIPAFPTHWVSNNLNGVKNVVLWQKSMKQCKNTTVVFSLVEEDLEPWNGNDLIGSVHLNITCEEGKMKTAWSIPNASNTTLLSGSLHGFKFMGSGAEYNAMMNVTANHIPIKYIKDTNSPRIQIRERLRFP